MYVSLFSDDGALRGIYDRVTPIGKLVAITSVERLLEPCIHAPKLFLQTHLFMRTCVYMGVH